MDPLPAGVPSFGRRRSPVRRALAGLAACAAVAATGGSAVPSDDGAFLAGRAFLEPISPDPALDPDSDALTALVAEGAPAVLNTGLYGQPIYEATSDTPLTRVQVTRRGLDAWGDNVLAHTDVRIPPSAVPSAGDDGKLVVVDRQARQVVDLWRAERGSDGRWSAEWGGLYPLDGSGSSRTAAYGDGPHEEQWPAPLSRGTGSGISSLAGVLRPEELAEGRIDHALVFSTDRACGPAQTGDHRWPATTTDGWVTDRPCLPQGVRLQLDPTLDLDALPGLTRAERVVGRALQEYGAYCIDIGGSRLALVGEVATTQADRDAYTAAFGPSGVSPEGYQRLEGLPLTALRVLARWDA